MTRFQFLPVYPDLDEICMTFFNSRCSRALSGGSPEVAADTCAASGVVPGGADRIRLQRPW